MRTAAGYPIRAVARLTGISAETLRAWERRYQAVVPVRSDRGRVYNDRQVERLKHLAALIGEGHAIGTIAGLSDERLRKLRPTGTAVKATAAAPDLEPLFSAVQRYDLSAIEETLNRHALVLPPATLIFSVILPVLREAGARWAHGSVRPAQEHLLSGIVRGVLGGLLRALDHPTASSRIVFATPTGERHELGLLCGAVLAAAAGHAVIYLGPDLPAEDIIHAIRSADARMVVLAAVAPGQAYEPGLRRLARLPHNVSMYVGGAQAHALREAIGPRAKILPDLETFRSLIERT